MGLIADFPVKKAFWLNYLPRTDHYWIHSNEEKKELGGEIKL